VQEDAVKKQATEETTWGAKLIAALPPAKTEEARALFIRTRLVIEKPDGSLVDPPRRRIEPCENHWRWDYRCTACRGE
jgi:hypothetical protein